MVYADKKSPKIISLGTFYKLLIFVNRIVSKGRIHFSIRPLYHILKSYYDSVKTVSTTLPQESGE